MAKFGAVKIWAQILKYHGKSPPKPLHSHIGGGEHPPAFTGLAGKWCEAAWEGHQEAEAADQRDTGPTLSYCRQLSPVTWDRHCKQFVSKTNAHTRKHQRAQSLSPDGIPPLACALGEGGGGGLLKEQTAFVRPQTVLQLFWNRQSCPNGAKYAPDTPLIRPPKAADTPLIQPPQSRRYAPDTPLIRPQYTPNTPRYTPNTPPIRPRYTPDTPPNMPRIRLSYIYHTPRSRFITDCPASRLSAEPVRPPNPLSGLFHQAPPRPLTPL